MFIATLLSMNSIWIALIGLGAGVLGGMLGVGGSVIMIPGLTIIFGHDQHLYQASAMLANVAVSVPAALRHHKAGAMMGMAVKRILPWALASVLVGVALSNMSVFRGSDGGLWLGRVMAVFLIYVIYINVRRLFSSAVKHAEGKLRTGAGRCAAVGGAMGATAGLLGIGGGAIAVPLQQILMHIPLRNAIATSSAMICITATVGAAYKICTLDQHGHTWVAGLTTGLLLAPTAWIGGRIGASLTHRLPLRQVRVAFIALMVVAAIKMAAIPWSELTAGWSR